MRAFYLISYDISSDRQRLKVAHLLEGYGARVQYSVFEIWATSEELDALRKRLEACVEEEGSVRIYTLCAACRERREVLGEGEPTSPPELRII
jgi:CRISPR-associated protein Cas2